MRMLTTCLMAIHGAVALAEHIGISIPNSSSSRVPKGEAPGACSIETEYRRTAVNGSRSCPNESPARIIDEKIARLQYKSSKRLPPQALVQDFEILAWTYVPPSTQRLVLDLVSDPSTAVSPFSRPVTVAEGIVFEACLNTTVGSEVIQLLRGTKTVYSKRALEAALVRSLARPKEDLSFLQTYDVESVVDYLMSDLDDPFSRPALQPKKSGAKLRGAEVMPRTASDAFPPVADVEDSAGTTARNFENYTQCLGITTNESSSGEQCRQGLLPLNGAELEMPTPERAREEVLFTVQSTTK